MPLDKEQYGYSVTDRAALHLALTEARGLLVAFSALVEIQGSTWARNELERVLELIRRVKLT